MAEHPEDYVGCVKNMAKLSIPMAEEEIRRRWTAYVVFASARVYINAPLRGVLDRFVDQDPRMTTQQAQNLHDLVAASISAQTDISAPTGTMEIINGLQSEHRDIFFTYNLLRRYLNGMLCFTRPHSGRTGWVHSVPTNGVTA
jgi:hypothetical protein